MKYRKKPVVIEAVQFNGNDFKAVYSVFKSAKEWRAELRDNSWVMFIPTLEGIMEATDGDFIIKGVKGEFYPCKPDIFELTYEAVEKP